MVALSAILARITGVPHTIDGPYFVCAEPDGEPYLARWDEVVLGARPSEEQMSAAGLVVAQETATVKIREACRAYIYAFYSQEKQLNVGADESARATAPPPALEAMYSHDDFLRMHEFKNEARVICNMACAEVETAGSIEAVAAVMTELEYLYGLEIPA